MYSKLYMQRTLFFLMMFYRKKAYTTNLAPIGKMYPNINKQTEFSSYCNKYCEMGVSGRKKVLQQKLHIKAC